MDWYVWGLSLFIERDWCHQYLFWFIVKERRWWPIRVKDLQWSRKVSRSKSNFIFISVHNLRRKYIFIKYKENQKVREAARKDTKELRGRIRSWSQNLQKCCLQTGYWVKRKNQRNKGSAKSFYRTKETLGTIYKSVFLVNGSIENVAGRWNGLYRGTVARSWH